MMTLNEDYCPISTSQISILKDLKNSRWNAIHADVVRLSNFGAALIPFFTRWLSRSASMT
jgi:hypothetical protein